MAPSRVGLTRDFLMPDGSFAFGDVGLDRLEQAPGVKYEFLAEDTRELTSPFNFRDAAAGLRGDRGSHGTRSHPQEGGMPSMSTRA